MKEAPEEIAHVSRGQFSVARHYGGCQFMGHHYWYDADRDVLVRSDVHQARLKARSKEARDWARAERRKWQERQKSLL